MQPPYIPAHAAGSSRCATEQLPHDDYDEMTSLDLIVDTLHGEELTRTLLRCSGARVLGCRSLNPLYARPKVAHVGLGECRPCVRGPF